MKKNKTESRSKTQVELNLGDSGVGAQKSKRLTCLISESERDWANRKIRSNLGGHFENFRSYSEYDGNIVDRVLTRIGEKRKIKEQEEEKNGKNENIEKISTLRVDALFNLIRYRSKAQTFADAWNELLTNHPKVKPNLNCDTLLIGLYATKKYEEGGRTSNEASSWVT